MMRNLVIAMAVAAVCAVGAASACAAEFHTDGPAFVKGTSVTETSFTFDVGTVTCEAASFTGEQASTASPVLKLVPSTSGCTGPGFSIVEVDWNGCYQPHRITFDPGPPSRFTNRIEISCPTTMFKKDEVEITFFTLGVRTCTVHIPEQTIESGGVYTNGEAEGVKNFTTDYSVSTLQYSQVAGGGVPCANASGTKNGTMTGQVLVTATNEKKAATSIWVE